MRHTWIFAPIIAALLTGPASAAGPQVAPLAGQDKADIAAYYKNGSRLLKALKYRDTDGSSRIVAIGANPNGEKFDARDDKSYTSIHAYGFVEDHGSRLVRWEIKEYHDMLCAVKVLTPLFDVIDAGDGQPLTMVPYWIPCDGLDATRVKLIVVYKDRKYAIRGQIPNQEEDEETREPGENFRELPAAVRKTALAYWAKVVAATKKDGYWEE